MYICIYVYHVCILHLLLALLIYFASFYFQLRTQYTARLMIFFIIFFFIMTFLIRSLCHLPLKFMLTFKNFSQFSVAFYLMLYLIFVQNLSFSRYLFLSTNIREKVHFQIRLYTVSLATSPKGEFYAKMYILCFSFSTHIGILTMQTTRQFVLT